MIDYNRVFVFCAHVCAAGVGFCEKLHSRGLRVSV